MKIEITCDKYISGKGYETRGCVLATEMIDASELDSINLADIVSNSDWEFDTDDSTDYRLELHVYDDDQELEDKVQAAWASEL